MGRAPSARTGGVRQAPRAQEAARLWLLPSGPDQVHAAPLLGTRQTPPARAEGEQAPRQRGLATCHVSVALLRATSPWPFYNMAERGGFEPPASFWPALAFQASSLSHSVTSPCLPLARCCAWAGMGGRSYRTPWPGCNGADSFVVETAAADFRRTARRPMLSAWSSMATRPQVGLRKHPTK